MSSLHSFVSPEYLPSEWGGNKGEYNSKAITRLVKENENKLIGTQVSTIFSSTFHKTVLMDVN